MTSIEALDIAFVPLAEHHLDEVMAIEVEAYPEPWTRAMFRDEIRSPRSHFYIMFAGEEMAGYGGFWLVLDEAHITSVTVRDTFRGRKLGRRLTVFLLESAKDAGAVMATLEVRESNTVARTLYESLGFKPVGIRKKYYPKSNEDAVVMLLEFKR